MSRQTSITNDPNAAYEGQISRSSDFANTVITKIVSSSSGLSAGRFVTQATADEQCVLPGASGDVTGIGGLGFTAYNAAIAGNWPLPSTTGMYQQGQVVPILRRGRIWVITEQSVTPASTVFVRYASGTFTVIGRVRADSDSSSAVALPTARFCRTAGIGALVDVEINLV